MHDQLQKNVTNVRSQCVKAGSVAIQHDFTEAMTIQHNKEVQSKYFGGNVTFSIEGNAIHYPDHDSYSVDEKESNTLFDFYSFLSDYKT